MIRIQPLHGATLGLARSVLALATALTLASHSSEELLQPLGVPIGDATGSAFWPNGFSLFSLAPPSSQEPVRWLAVGCLVLVATGWRPRVTCLLHWWISSSFFLSAVPIEGGDQVAAVLSLLLVPIGLTDGRRWHWSAQGRQQGSVLAYSAWLVIRLQVAVIYLHAAVGKTQVAEWRDGTALYYWIGHPLFGAPPWLRPLAGLTTHEWFIVPATWGVILLEFALASALFMARRWWPAMLGLGILFHLAIALTHGLVTFSLAMTAALLLFLRDPGGPLMGPSALVRRVSARVGSLRAAGLEHPVARRMSVEKRGRGPFSARSYGIVELAKKDGS